MIGAGHHADTEVVITGLGAPDPDLIRDEDGGIGGIITQTCRRPPPNDVYNPDIGLTVLSSEPEAITLSLKGFHLMSITGPAWPVTRPTDASTRPVCGGRVRSVVKREQQVIK